METDISYSPSVVKKQEAGQYNFYEALRMMTEGKKMTKLEWGNSDEYGFLKAEILHIHRNGEDHRWVISEADIAGTDYFIVEEI